VSQTTAILKDAYREVNSKKMFWVVLVLSAIVVAAFAAVGINDKGLTVLWFQFESGFNTRLITPAMFYRMLFTTLGIGFWLTWIAMALALISTAGSIPEFVTGGAVDLYVSKPISRLRLFLTKYASNLLFVAIQVGVFSLASFLVIGIRGGVWDARLFLAIPLVVLVFSYLYAVCVLLGLWTRSTIASLLLTILFWLSLWGVTQTEMIMLLARTAGDKESAAYARLLTNYDLQAEQFRTDVAAGEGGAAERLAGNRKQKEALLAKKAKTDPGRHSFRLAHQIFYGVKTALPKTAEATYLLERALGVVDPRDAQRAERAERRNGRFRLDFSDGTEVKWMENPDVILEVQEQIKDRPAWWVVGTSLAFEAVVLGIACWVFCRRDF
jgi:ABC-type transport system involved in multi-copper enzyme maturation permease subunit